MEKHTKITKYTETIADNNMIEHKPINLRPKLFLVSCITQLSRMLPKQKPSRAVAYREGVRGVRTPHWHDKNFFWYL